VQGADVTARVDDAQRYAATLAKYHHVIDLPRRLRLRRQ
jgi:hypothetical protein